MNKQQTHTTHPPTPTTLILTGVGEEFGWKYTRVLGTTIDTYERRQSRVGRSEGWWLDIEPRDARRGTVCPTHHVQRTPSGRCDQCD